MIEIRELLIEDIQRPYDLQPRLVMNNFVVDDYAAAMAGGDEFPPVVVFQEGTDYWLADGWHRVEAVIRCGRVLIMAEIHQGTKRDALMWSTAANATHGLRRSNADKRRSVRTLLEDAEWGQWSDREIARKCRVSHPLVSAQRKELSGNSSRQRTFERAGTVSTMDTTPIAAANEARAEDQGDTPDTRLLTPASYAPIWRLEQAVNQYLDVQHGVRGVADENHMTRLESVVAIVESRDYSVLVPHISQAWLVGDLRQALNNVCEQLRQVGREAAPVEPAEEGSPLPEQQASAWATGLPPDETSVKTAPAGNWLLTIFLHDLQSTPAEELSQLTITVIVEDPTHHVQYLETSLQELPHFTQRIIEHIATNIDVDDERGDVPIEPPDNEVASPTPVAAGTESGTAEEPTAEPEPGPMYQFPIGAFVRWDDLPETCGKIMNWTANGRVAFIRQQDGRGVTMPAFMLKELERSAVENEA